MSLSAHQWGDMRGEALFIFICAAWEESVHTSFAQNVTYIIPLYCFTVDYLGGALLFKNFKSMLNVLYSFLCDIFSLLFKLKDFVSVCKLTAVSEFLGFICSRTF